MSYLQSGEKVKQGKPVEIQVVGQWTLVLSPPVSNILI